MIREDRPAMRFDEKAATPPHPLKMEIPDYPVKCTLTVNGVRSEWVSFVPFGQHHFDISVDQL